MGLFGPKNAIVQLERKENMDKNISYYKLIQIGEWEGFKVFMKKEEPFSYSVEEKSGAKKYSFKSKSAKGEVELNNREQLDLVALFKDDIFGYVCRYSLKEANAKEEESDEEGMFHGYPVISEKEFKDICKKSNANVITMGNNIKFADLDGAGFNFGNSNWSGGVCEMTLNGHYIKYNDDEGVVGILMSQGKMYIVLKD